MRVYIGAFEEDDANIIADALKKAGIKSELRHALDVEIKKKHFIKGKLSELKEKYKDNKEIGKIIQDIEKYIEKAREVMKDGIEEREFEESFLDSLFPERKNEEYMEISKEMKEGMKGVIDINEVYDRLIEKFGKEKINDFLDKFQNELNVMSLVHHILENNGIKYENGKMYGKINEDPEIKIYLRNGKDLEYETTSWISKRVDIYANLIDALYEVEKLRKVAENNHELLPLLYMADVISRIIDKIENKMPLEKLMEEISSIKEENEEIKIGRDAINEIIKTLEKGEIIKIKNGKIILREKRKR